MVIWRQAAYTGVARIIHHIAAENPIAAGHVARELLLAGDSLTLFPYRGRPGRVLGTRELVAYPPYILVYRVAPQGEVTILRVWHAAQSRAW
jgi:plasmid stabilization system protein ParE